MSGNATFSLNNIHNIARIQKCDSLQNSNHKMLGKRIDMSISVIVGLDQLCS